jgi:hypothetical protein
LKKLLVVVACLTFFAASALPAGAASGVGPPPIPTCLPGLGPCQETDHFGEFLFVGSPLPGCTSLAGAALIDTKGNGVQHINVNTAQDFWFTTTMVGPTHIIQGTAQFDQMGNYIPGTFVPDTTLPTIDGHLQQWFGQQANKNNFSASSTGNFQGTNSNGVSVSLHFNFHFNSTGSHPFMLNMSSFHFDVSCS